MDASFFARLGLYVREDFLPADTRSSLLATIRAAEASTSTLARATGDAVDESQRSSKWALVGDDVHDAMAERVDALRPELERHFERPLGPPQKPQFLVYREGDHFQAHRDNSQTEATSDYARDRAVSVVTFVNGEGDDDESFRGGTLTFYDLMGNLEHQIRRRSGGSEKVGLPLTGTPGLLVAFDSTALHGVSPVTQGERYTIVTWFRDAGDSGDAS